MSLNCLGWVGKEGREGRESKAITEEEGNQVRFNILIKTKVYMHDSKGDVAKVNKKQVCR